MFCGRFWPFNCQKLFTHVICGKCVFKAIDYAFVSKWSISFEKIIFLRDYVWVGGKDKIVECSTNIGIMLFCNYKLWFENGKISSICTCG